MLVLSRKVGEKIIIAEDIIVQVIDVKVDRVRFGITAPRDISVDRAEVHARKSQAKVETVPMTKEELKAEKLKVTQ